MKHKLKHTLTEEDIMLLCEFLEEGYSIIESIDLVSVYEKEQPFLNLKSRLLSGESFQNALSYFEIKPEWLEYFNFMSRFDSISKAMRGAKQLTEMKQIFLHTLQKQLSYPLCLIICMLFFSIFMVTSIQPQLNQLLNSFDMSTGLVEKMMFHMITFLPLAVTIVIISIAFYYVHIYLVLTSRNFYQIKKKMQDPFSRTVLQYYYSLKFAYFYATLSLYVQGLFDGITLMYERMSTSDLMVVVYELKKGLDQGQKLEKLIESSIYFHPSFKKYCLILLKQGKSMSLLEDYVEKTMLYLEKKIKKYSRITVFIIYSSTSLFIVILYLLMMLPMFQIVSQL